MFLISGTVPIEDMPLIMGPAELDGDNLIVEGFSIPCGMGTAAMVSSAVETASFMGTKPPVALLAGDIGDAAGSRKIYDKLCTELPVLSPRVVTLHYLQPVMGLMRRVMKTVDAMDQSPVMIADAGAMYAAKAAGLSGKFDLFTPDIAEMKFLADPDAVHPAYVSNYFIQADNVSVDELIKSFYEHLKGPEVVLMKGALDLVIKNGEIVSTVSEPDIPELEPVGGTGDTVTGLVSALIYAGLDPVKASIIACRTNRMAGSMASVRPDTRVSEIIACFKEVYGQYYQMWSDELMD